MRTKTLNKKSEQDIISDERTCPEARFWDNHLSVPQMGDIFRNARHYVCTILEDKCKRFIAELIMMRNASQNKDSDLEKELKKVPEVIFTGEMSEKDFMDAIRNTFGIIYRNKLERKFPMICRRYDTITDDAREIIHLNNLLVAMIKGSSMANNFDNLARCMSYEVKDMEGKR